MAIDFSMLAKAFCPFCTHSTAFHGTSGCGVCALEVLAKKRARVCKHQVKRNETQVTQRDTVAKSIVRQQVEGAVLDIMEKIDPTGPRPSTDDTPKRVARMFMEELTAGYYVDIPKLFEAVFPNEGAQGMVLVKNIPLYSLCEHHWLVITGEAHVAYLPEDCVLGLSKVARVVDAYARRFQIQERLTKQVLDAMDDNLAPLGTAVMIEAEHHCLSIRGAQKPGTITVTTAFSGEFEEMSMQETFMRQVKS